MPTDQDITGYPLAFLLPSDAAVFSSNASDVKFFHSPDVKFFHSLRTEPQACPLSVDVMEHAAFYGLSQQTTKQAYFFSHGEYVLDDKQQRKWKPGIPHGSLATPTGQRSSVELRGSLSKRLRSNDTKSYPGTIIRGKVIDGHKRSKISIKYEIRYHNKQIERWLWTFTPL